MTDRSPWVSAVERRRFLLVAFAGFAAAAVALAPASVGAWALGRASPLLAVAGAEGTLWRGRLAGVSYNGVLVGDIDYRLAALPLFLGRIDVDAQSANGALTGRTRLSLRGGGAVVSKRVGTVTIAFADGQERARGSAKAGSYVVATEATLPEDIRQQITRERKPGDPDAAVDPLSDPAVRAAVQRATFEMLVGFNLSQQQLAYNVTR